MQDPSFLWVGMGVDIMIALGRLPGEKLEALCFVGSTSVIPS